jgi:hypothetical protein
MMFSRNVSPDAAGRVFKMKTEGKKPRLEKPIFRDLGKYDGSTARCQGLIS